MHLHSTSMKLRLILNLGAVPLHLLRELQGCNDINCISQGCAMSLN